MNEKHEKMDRFGWVIPVPEEKAERNKEIIQKREEGKTCKEIAIQYGISRTRVYQICEEEKRKKEKVKDEIDCLPRRVRNALFRKGIHTKEELIQLFNDNEVVYIRNLGKKSMKTISEFTGLNLEQAFVKENVVHCGLYGETVTEERKMGYKISR